MFSALATHYRTEVFRFDDSSFFLNPNIEEDVYVEKAPGFDFTGKGLKLACRLLKGLYGLKRAGLCWKTTHDKIQLNSV